MDVFEVLGQPIRRRIVEMLASGEHTAGEICAIVTTEFGVGRSAVQHHLAVFRRLGWVRVRTDWTEHYYRLDAGVIPRLEKEVRRLRSRWDRRIGWTDGTDPLGVNHPSKRGHRGHGRDPDDPWRAR